MSSFPTGVVVFTTLDGEDRPWGLTCSSLASVTLTPPTLLVCVKSSSETLNAACSSGLFGVNLLHARGQRAAEVFAGPIADRFAEVPWTPFGRYRLPYLAEDAFAFATCRVAGTMVAGDHTIVFGEVAEVTHTADVPLLYGMRQFSSWFTADKAA